MIDSYFSNSSSADKIGAGVLVRIANLKLVEQSFGEGNVKEIKKLICKTIIEEFSCVFLRQIEYGQFLFALDNVKTFIVFDEYISLEIQVSRCITSILLTKIIDKSVNSVVPALDVFCAIPGESAPLDSNSENLLSSAYNSMMQCDGPKSMPFVNKTELVTLMGNAASFMTHLIGGDIVFNGYPIVGSDGALLYESCVPAVLGNDNAMLPIGEFYDSLCATAPTPVVDEYLLIQLLGNLTEHNDSHLGLRLGALGAGSREFLAMIIDYLKNNRKLARRLVIEMDGSFGFTTKLSWIQFCNSVKAIGCRLAIDRFGAGNSAVRDLLIFKPDFVKIDSGFLWRAQGGMEGFRTLQHLIGLIHSLRSTAIVCGVNSPQLTKLASDAGGVWHMGQQYGMGRRFRFEENWPAGHLQKPLAIERLI